MPTSKPKHIQAHVAVNTPPSRDPDLMRRMYSLLTRCRSVAPETRGVEATWVGSLMGLLTEDSLVVCGGVPDGLLEKPKSPELLDIAPLDPEEASLPPDAQIALAAGYALARVLQDKAGLVLAFIGESSSLRSARATLSFAATHKLPLVVVVQHNLAKTSEVADMSHEILGTSLPGMTVDGSDAMAVYRVTQEAMYRARHHGGPTLVECKVYRKANIPARIRPWVQGDAVKYMEQQLRARDFWRDELRTA